jgi:ABC-type multidrug transport system fused ATPase/permease subunit
MNYMVTLVTTDSYAKEVKLFGLGGYFIDRYRLIANAYYGTQRSQVARRYMTGFVLGNLSTIATSFTYLYVALQAVAGRLTLGHLILYTTAAQSVQGSIQGILGGFSGMYEHNLYLNNLFELMATETKLPAPANPVPLENAAKAAYQLHQVRVSAQLYEDLLRVAPQRGDLWKTLGAIYYFELADKPNALRAFRQALLRERDPGEKGKLEAMVRELEG